MITYTFKIKPNKTQINQFENHLNITRLVYNIAKETKEYAYSKGQSLSCYDLMKQLPELKKEFTWMKEVNAQTLQGVIERLDKGYIKFFRDLKKGAKVSKPHWASKKKWKSVEFKQSGNNPILRFEKDNKFNLPKIGKIKIFKSREVYGNMKLARVLKECDGWYLQIVTDYERPKCDSQAEVGIDLGIRHFVITSDGEYFENINVLKKNLKKLRVEQRSLSRKKKGSNNWYKQVKRVQKLYLKISRIRKDYLHKVSTSLASNYSTVYCEDLDISKMLENPIYSRSISDVSWYSFTEMLNYKTNLVKVDAMYSSQECNNCGHVSKENRKTQENFKCVKCNHSGNADFEASLTILKRGQSLLHVNVNH